MEEQVRKEKRRNRLGEMKGGTGWARKEEITS